MTEKRPTLDICSRSWGCCSGGSGAAGRARAFKALSEGGYGDGPRPRPSPGVLSQDET